MPSAPGMLKRLGLAVGVLVLTLLVLLVTRTRDEATPTRVPAPDPAAARTIPLEPSIQPDPSRANREPSTDSTRWIRIRRAGGRVDVVEDDGEALRPLEQRIRRAEELFNEAVKEFQENFMRTLEAKGAAEAWSLLSPYLRNPTRDVCDIARVHRAVDLLVRILHGIGLNAEHSRPFAPLAPNLNARLRSLLSDDSITPNVKAIALVALGGCTPSIAFHGPMGTLVDGLYTYDEEEPIAPTVMVDYTPPLKQSIAHSLLGEPEFAELLARMVKSDDSWIRKAALIAVAGRRELLDSIDLVGIAAYDPSDRVRETAMLLLPGSKAGSDPEAFLTILKAQESDDLRAVLLKRFGAAVGLGPELGAVLRGALATPPPVPEDPNWWKTALYIEAAIEVGLDQYARAGDPQMFSLLTSRISSWALWEGKGDSPLACLARHAAKRELREFSPHLRTALPSVRDEWNKRLIREALQKLEP